MWWRRNNQPEQTGSDSAAAEVRPAVPLDDEFAYLQSMVDGRMTAQELVIPWRVRAQELGARSLALGRGVALLQEAWSYQGPNQPFGREELLVMGPFFEYYALAAGLHIVHQSEYGDYMLVQLTGVIAVERAQTAGPPVRMAQTNIGDVIGEMSLLDQGQRFSSCVTLTPCDVAVLTRAGLERMLAEQPLMAANVLLMLARKLSIRLRSISAKIR
ncbi:Crp/Fnr family transcriptional regulator [Lampropedia aestuarii]|uniref:Crp/Fnr family transcriptional regulator n=1 Tax=Lampropedia aestuarii TaxID=2562762 RepID=UPI00246854D9|nr:Crp/Fnr family transcriptional regulator [Lampropedia aestuarii]MDH5858773.1 Crp/Fnr family transcriptional regulator [Lampropedia aestuarii]